MPNVPAFSQQLLHWYEQYKRPLPWRKAVNVYHTLLSEIMSQQTTMAVVVPRFLEFTEALPSLEALAHCEEELLRRLWAGLGYYARARNLKKAAIEIVVNRKGQFPQTYEEWLEIPGVGPYTASILASVCLNEPVACVDGNVIRVMSRIKAFADVWNPAGQNKIRAWALELMNQNRPGDFNQAMMELGATVCRKQTPLCEICPVAIHCIAREKNLTDVLPPNKPRAAEKQVRLNTYIFKDSKTGALLVGERGGGRFLSKTHGFLVCEAKDAEDLTLAFKKDPFLQLNTFSKTFSHTITNHKLTVQVIEVSTTHASSIENYIKNKFNSLKFQNYSWVNASEVVNALSTSFDKKAYEVARSIKN